jgi:NAD(P)H-flavin reductase
VSSGSGSDPHLLALLRAIRLRLAAPEAAAAGVADTGAALGGTPAAKPAAASPAGETGHPQWLTHPDRPAAPRESNGPDAAQHLALPPAAQHLALPPAAQTPALPPAAQHLALPPAAQTPALPPAAQTPALPPAAQTPALPASPPTPAVPASPPAPPLPAVPASPAVPPLAAVPASPALPPLPAAHPFRGESPGGVPRADREGAEAGNRPRSVRAGGGLLPRPGATTPYPPGAGPWAGSVSVPPVFGSSTEPISGIPGSGGPRPAGPQWPADPVGASSPVGPVRMPGSVPPVTPGPALSVDGMDPADDAALRELVRLLGNSLSLAGGPDEVAGRLRATLTQAQPVLFAQLPGGPAAQVGQLAEALTWLVHHLDQPSLLVNGCGRLGAALAECGVLPQQLQLAGAALAEAMRAGMAAGGWRQDFDLAWRSTWQHAYEWIAHGMTTGAYRPAVWTAVVVAHERRRDDLAVLRLRPYLPMPFRPGQYARLEVPGQPGVWRPYSLTGAPRRDNVVELHVRAKSHSGVSGALVYRTAVGDKARIARAEGEMGLPESGRDLLMIAGDTGVVPLKAMLTELAETGDPRSAVLFWGVRDLSELYDIDDITRIARSCRRATVIPVISEGESGPYAGGLVTDAVAAYGEWSGHEVYLAGPPLMLVATSAALQQLGVAPERIHHDQPG